MGPQDMLQMCLDRGMDLPIRRSLFKQAMIELAGSEQLALQALRVLVKGADVMEFLARDPYGDLICCEWLHLLTQPTS